MRAFPPRAAAVAVASLAVAVLLGACSPGSSLAPAPTESSPSVTPSPTPPAELAAALASTLSDTELVGQVLMPSIGLSASPEESARVVTDLGLGGVILMGNVQDTGAGGTAAQVRALTDALHGAGSTVGGQRLPMLIATDQEYGWVTRIRSGVVQLPSAMAFGAAARPDLTQAAWAGAGQELAAVGINVDFAPVADVIGNPANYIIGSRSFGASPAIVGPQVAAAVAGLQSSGVAAALKHFPGHGNTAVDSHTALPVLHQSLPDLLTGDLAPFQDGIDAGAQLVMSGHLDVQAIDPGVPATFSSKVLIDVLRGELGFTGVVVTDALNMAPAMRWPAGEAAVRALLAGNDLLLMTPSLVEARDGLLAALGSGQLPRERLLEAVTRVLTLKYTLAGNERPDMSTVDNPAHRAASAAVAAAAVTVLSGPCSGPLVPGPINVTASGGRDQQVQWLNAALTAAGVSVVHSGGTRVHLVGYGDGTGDLASGAAVTVAMDTPYLLASSNSPVRVATYSGTEVAMRALADVIAGKASAPGRSPVGVNGLPASACVT